MAQLGGLIAQAAVTGLLIGGVYALIAAGLTMIFGVLGFLNLAHGEFVMVAMYLAYFLTVKAGWNPYATVLVTVPALLLLGGVVYRLLVRPALGTPLLTQVVLTVGLLLVMQNTALVAFKATTRSLPVTEATAAAWRLGGFYIEPAKVIAFAFAVAVTVALFAFLRHTDMGRAIRAVAQSPEHAMRIGLPTRRIFLVAFSLGTGILGVAGSVLIPLFAVEPAIGGEFLLIALMVVILGGLGDFRGALAGGLITGVAVSIGQVTLPGSLGPVVGFVIMVVLLFIRPAGIFGGKGV